MSAKPKHRWTEAEYLAYDASHPGRHEFVNGEIIVNGHPITSDGEAVAMAGASEAHELIVANLIRALGNRLAGGPCRVYGSNFRVQVDETGLYAYPDAVVVCGKSETTGERPRTLLNPKLVVEVLSESTEGYDLGAKAAHYRQRASVSACLFVRSKERRAQLHVRTPEGAWILTDAEGVGTVDIGPLDVRLPLDEVYAGWDPSMAEESVPRDG